MDLSSVIIWEGFSVYQAFGMATIILALLNIILYLYSAFLLWKSTHQITKALKHKMIVEAFLTTTTLFMGFNAFTQASETFWQLVYVCRVGLLMIAPFILYRLVKACLAILDAQETADGKHGRNNR